MQQEHELSRKLEAALERLNLELPVGLRVLYRALDLKNAYSRTQKVPPWGRCPRRLKLCSEKL